MDKELLCVIIFYLSTARKMRDEGENASLFLLLMLTRVLFFRLQYFMFTLLTLNIEIISPPTLQKTETTQKQNDIPF